MSEAVTTSAPSAPSTGSSSGAAQTSAPTSGQSQGTSQPTGNGTAQGQASVQETQAGSQTPEITPPAKRYLEADADEALVKIKVDGQEREVSLKELKRLNSLEQASQRRLQEAAKQQKEFQRMVEIARQNPAEYLKQIGKDPDSWAEEILARKYEMAQLSPVERENLEMKSRIEAQERMELESKKSVIDEIKKLSDKVPENLEKYSKEDLANYRDHLNSVNVQAQQALQTEMISAWEETKLPKHKTWANWMAMEMMAHEKRTNEPLQAKDAAVKVKADWLKFNQHIFRQMDAQAIQEVLGKEIVQKLIDQRIQGVTDQATTGFQKQNAQPQAASDNQKPYMNETEYRAWLKQG